MNDLRVWDFPNYVTSFYTTMRYVCLEGHNSIGSISFGRSISFKLTYNGTDTREDPYGYLYIGVDIGNYIAI